MIKSITAAQKISISINIYTNKYYPGAAGLGFRTQEDSGFENLTTWLSPLTSPMDWLVKSRDRGTVSCELTAHCSARILINLAAGAGQCWMSRAPVGIFTKGKNNSKHLVLVLLFARLTPHTYGEALITMTAFPHTCQHTASQMISRYLSFNFTI